MREGATTHCVRKRSPSTIPRALERNGPRQVPNAQRTRSTGPMKPKRLPNGTIGPLFPPIQVAEDATIYNSNYVCNDARHKKELTGQGLRPPFGPKGSAASDLVTLNSTSAYSKTLKSSNPHHMAYFFLERTGFQISNSVRPGGS